MSSKPIPIDLMIFDFDGTLTDSIPPAVEAIQKMLRALKLPYKTNEEINEHVGFGEISLIAGVIGTKEPKLFKKAMKMYESIYMKEGLKKVLPYPHIREMLEYFKDKTKIILSNKKDLFIKKILESLGLKSYFKEICGGDTLPCLKPDPGAINEMIKRYKVDRGRVLFVGDMTVDVMAGKNAGIRTCAVTYGFESREKLMKFDPDLLIDDPLKLKSLIV